MNEHTCHLCESAYYSHQQLSHHVTYTHNTNWNGVVDEPLPPRQLRKPRMYVIEEEP